MLRRVTGVAAVGLLFSSAAWAQDSDYRTRLELSGLAGYAFNQRLNSNIGSNIYNRIGPRDDFTYGAELGYYATPNLEVGFLWSGQRSELELRDFNRQAAVAAAQTSATSVGVPVVSVQAMTNSANDFRVGKMTINTYHGILAWNFGPQEARVRPFVFGGAGVTHYNNLDYEQAVTTTLTTAATATTPATTTTATAFVPASIPASSRFSTTWGVGVKVAPVHGLGLRLAGRWTPTRINSSNSGWWCDGALGCYTNGGRYQNEFAVTGGITARF